MAMIEAAELDRIRARVNELMSGGPFSDRIRPGKTAWHIEKEFGVAYEGYEI